MDKINLPLVQRFTYSCLELKHLAKKISNQQYNTLKILVNFGQSAKIELLEQCFPKIIADYRNYCKKNNKETDFSDKSFLDFLLATHRKFELGSCSLEIAKIKDLPIHNKLFVVCGDERRFFENPFGFEGLNKDIYVHLSTITGPFVK
jgi:hypothetical protein